MNCYDPNDKDKGLSWFKYNNIDGKAYYDYGCGKIIPKTAAEIAAENIGMIVFYKPKGSGSLHHINISRIELYDNQDQKIKLKPYKYSSIAQNYKLKKCIDGKNNTFCHTAWVRTHEWTEGLSSFDDQYKKRRFISFTFPNKVVKKIYIRNRSGQEGRLNNMRVTIYPNTKSNIEKLDGNIFNHVFKNSLLDINLYPNDPVRTANDNPPQGTGPYLHKPTGITYQVKSSWDKGKNNHFTPWIDSKQGWSSGVNDNKQWINMKFKKQYVKNITIQGRVNGDHGQYLKKFDLYYKDDANKWVLIGTKTSNTKNNTKKKIPVKKTTKEIQLNIKKWNKHITFRVGVEFGIAPPPPCVGPMC